MKGVPDHHEADAQGGGAFDGDVHGLIAGEDPERVPGIQHTDRALIHDHLGLRMP